jgi:hypothetical protein
MPNHLGLGVAGSIKSKRSKKKAKAKAEKTEAYNTRGRSVVSNPSVVKRKGRL